MKNLNPFFIAIALFTFSNTNAQITKGNWMMGGNGSFSYSKYESKNTSSTSGTTINNIKTGSYYILLEPNIGYFIKDKFALGLKMSCTNYFDESLPFKLSNSSTAINPYVRYYFLKVDKNYNLFVEPSYYVYSNNNLSDANGYGLKSGFVFFLNSSVGIEPTLSYVHSENEKFKGNRLLFGIGFQIHLEKK
jgi:hypothetical protein